MTYALIWLFLSVAVGLYASGRGRGSGNWFLVSLILSPLIGLILCAASPNLAKEAEKKAAQDALPSLRTHVKCPQCAELVLPEATKCKHCGSDLTPDPGHANRRLLQEKQAADQERTNTIVGWSIIAGIGLLIWLFNK